MKSKFSTPQIRIINLFDPTQGSSIIHTSGETRGINGYNMEIHYGTTTDIRQF